jgi:dTDP-glucose 4,6-dehydratase
VEAAEGEAVLGWRPAVPFEKGLRDTVAWYRANGEWVANIRTGDYLKYYAQQYGG